MAFLALIILLPNPAYGSSITIPYVFVPGTTIVASQVNANFSTIAAVVNGQLDNTNLSAAANISLSKLNNTQTMLNLQTVSTVLSIGAGEAGDTVPRVGFYPTGAVNFGPGGSAAVDVGIARSAAGTLQVNDTVIGAAATAWDWAGTPQINVGTVSGTTAPALCGGRAYLATGAPYADHAASTGNVYYGPAVSNQINLGGTVQTFAETSIAIGAYANNVFDLYATSASSTTITLSTAAWGGINTPPTRGTDAYGRATKNGATGSLLVAVFYINGANQVTDNPASRWVSNVYNATTRAMFCQDTTASWAYAVATIRAANASTTDGIGRCSFVTWLPSAPVEATCFCHCTTGGGAPYIGIGIDSTTAFNTAAFNNSGQPLVITCSYAGTVATGYHYIQRLESETGGSASFYYTSVLSSLNGLSSVVYN